MKKIFAVLSFLLLFGGVKAEEAQISYHKLEGIYYNLNVNGTIQSNTVTMFDLSGRTAYCIEPGVEINTRYYDITDWGSVSISSKDKDLIEKIGYYGYEYPGHQNGYYYIGAQELIWQVVNPDISITWTSGKNMSGEIIDVTKYKNEIMSLVEKHSMIPSFSFESFKGEIGTTLTLEDTNNVLSDYSMSLSKYHDMKIDGNKITINLNSDKVDDEIITLTRNHYDDSPLLIYSRGDSQKLAALRITSDKDVTFTISNEIIPEEIEVPNTLKIDYSSLIGSVIMGMGIVLFKAI